MTTAAEQDRETFTLPKVAQTFLEHLVVERRASRNTVNAYTRDLTDFLAFIKKTDMQEINSHDVRNYILSLGRRELSPNSISRSLYCLRSFFRYQLNRGLLDDNPAIRVRAPKSSKLIPKVLDVDQVSKLLNKKAETNIEKRDKAMFEVLYSTGIRLSELVGLNINSIIRSEGLVRVTGKGNKTRIVPMGSPAIHAVNDWLETRIEYEVDDPLFTARGNHRISPRSVQSRLKKWGVETILSDTLHPHMLRHSFASHLLESSSDLRSVQEMLGHQNISTTQIYTHLDFQHLAKVYDDSHPRSNRVGPIKP